jgi:hypothetical protein
VAGALPSSTTNIFVGVAEEAVTSEILTGQEQGKIHGKHRNFDSHICLKLSTNPRVTASILMGASSHYRE